MSAHAPGPWKLVQCEDSGWMICTEGDVICVADFDRDESNFRLIAAAPCMLEALQELIADITGSAVLMDHITLARFDQAVAVIAKATEGRS